MDDKTNYKSGYVSIVGKPNVGKSTLINYLMGRKISIVTRKPQTTRNAITGVYTSMAGQIIFIDTPGIYPPKNALGELIVKAAYDSVKSVDIIYFVANPVFPDSEDIAIINVLKELGKSVFLVINKIDTIVKEKSLSIISKFTEIYNFKNVFLIAAINGDGVNSLLDSTLAVLPYGPKYYPDDYLTDMFERTYVQELIREKVMELTHDELPHAVTVEVMRWKEKKKGFISINANIYVEKDSQKGIIIGKGGGLIKEVGVRARKECESMLNARVFMDLFVKVKKDWRKSTKALKELGFY